MRDDNQRHKERFVQGNTPLPHLSPQFNMFVLFFLFALFRNYGASLPITDIPNVLDVRDVIPPAPVTVENHQLRSLFDIVWSCISTVFICTWVAIHPNVPPRGEGHIQSVWRQIKLMLWTLVVPEMVLVWAYRQWAAARYIAKLFEGEHGILDCDAGY